MCSRDTTTPVAGCTHASSSSSNQCGSAYTTQMALIVICTRRDALTVQARSLQTRGERSKPPRRRPHLTALGSSVAMAVSMPAATVTHTLIACTCIYVIWHLSRRQAPARRG